MRVLEIGARHRPLAADLFEGATVEILDINPDNNPDIVANAAQIPPEYHGLYDAVFSSHVLEHFSWKHSIQILAHWAALLKPDGTLHVVVPGLEWAAAQILAENPSPAVQIALYGGHADPFDFHYNGFTLRKLRSDFEKAGMVVERARSGPYTIIVNDIECEAIQHYIVGRKTYPAIPSKE